MQTQDRTSEKTYLAVAYNHDSSCLPEYASLGVSEIWAGVYLPDSSLFGSGRLQRNSIDKIVTYDDLGADFKTAKELGMKTSFLLNPACSGNVEFTKEGMEEIIKISKFLNKYKVDYITLAQPFLSKAFKKLAPDTKVKLSSHYNTNSIGKFQFLLDELDIDMVIVSQFANKNFKLLKEITKKWDPARLEVMCTVPCIMGCPMRTWHAQFYGHSTSLPDADYIPAIVPCLADSHHNTNIAISAMFVRREDLDYYKRLGINKFKIGERRDPTENNINCVKYYKGLNEGYVPFFRKSKILNKINLKALDGFYEKFFNEECDGTKYNCKDCTYCDDYAKKALIFTEKELEELKIPNKKDFYDKILFKKWLDEFDKM